MHHLATIVPAARGIFPKLDTIVSHGGVERGPYYCGQRRVVLAVKPSYVVAWLDARAGVIERVTGLTYDQYLQQSLLVPLHLRSTASCSHQDPLATGGRRAVGYHVVADSLAVRVMFAYVEPGMTGAGGLCSSAQDLARWMRALIDERAVSGASLRWMTCTRPVTAGFTPPYGFGLSLRPPLEEPAIWHEGVMAGFTSVVAYLPTSDLVIAIVTNGRRVPIAELLRRLELQMTGRARPITRDLPLPTAEATRDAGTYDDAMFNFRIVLDSGSLFFHGPFGPPARLFYQGGHDFVAVGPRALRFSFRPDTGAVTLVAWDWDEIRAYGKPSRH